MFFWHTNLHKHARSFYFTPQPVLCSLKFLAMTFLPLPAASFAVRLQQISVASGSSSSFLSRRRTMSRRPCSAAASRAILPSLYAGGALIYAPALGSIRTIFRLLLMTAPCKAVMLCECPAGAFTSAPWHRSKFRMSMLFPSAALWSAVLPNLGPAGALTSAPASSNIWMRSMLCVTTAA
jgi:hypothetical protein